MVPPRHQGALLTIFFLSGISGLIYQVLWVRGFSTLFGNTVHSASLVTGVFMAGLGAGAYVFGRLGDRQFRQDRGRPLRTYARLELGIGLLGLVLAGLLPRLAALSVGVSSYSDGTNGWSSLSAGSWLARYAIAVALTAPPTFLMGGTLTLLIRHLVASDVQDAPVRIGLLYGANTAGAACGALLTDFALVPGVGLLGAQVTAAAINFAAGGAALWLAARGADGRGRDGASEAPAPSPAPGLVTREMIGTGVALGLAGVAAMGLEMVWFRYLSGLLGALRAMFSLMLAVVLVGIWLGSVAGGYLHRRSNRPVEMFAIAQSLLMVVSLGLLLLPDHRTHYLTSLRDLNVGFMSLSPPGQLLREMALNLRPTVELVLVPAMLMGLSFPLANASVQRAEQAVGSRAGALYLANTVGNVVGSALVGFVLLPTIGMQKTALLLGVLLVVSSIVLVASRPASDGSTVPAGIAGGWLLAALSLAVYVNVNPGRLLEPSVPRRDPTGKFDLLAVSEGLSETIAVVDQMSVFRALYTNGHSMSSNHPKGQRYMRAFAHIPLLQTDAPERALVICFGVGSTLHAASLHPSIKRLEIADLSENVLRHASFFAASNHDVLSDPRTHVFVNDGRLHLLMQPPGTYDLVTLEPPPIAFAGVASLYSTEFYRLARERLRPGGYVTQWLPAYQVPEATVLAIVRSFVDVFPESVLLSGDDNELILMGTNGPSIAMDADAVARRLQQRPAVAADLADIAMGSMTEIAGTFAASPATMKAATRGTAPVTDDRPVMEYSLRSSLGTRRMPAALFDVGGIESFCPGCLRTVPDLDTYLAIRGRIYASDWFLLTGQGSPLPVLPDDARTTSVRQQSAYLRELFTGPGKFARAVGLRHLQAGRLPEAIRALTQASRLEPGDVPTMQLLAQAYQADGDSAHARQVLARIRSLSGSTPPGTPPAASAPPMGSSPTP